MEISLVFSNQTLTNSSLFNWSYSKSLGDGDLQVGQVSIAQFLFVSQVQKNIGDTFQLQIQFNGATNRNFGTFKIKNIQKTEPKDSNGTVIPTYTYQCFDILINADVDVSSWYNGQSYSTLSNLFTGLCSHLGLTGSFSGCNPTFPIATFSAKNLTGLTLLSQIAKIAGAYVTAEGGVVQVTKSYTGSTALTRAHYFSKTVADYETSAVTKVTIQTASSGPDQWTSVGSGDNTLYITDSYLAYGKSTETTFYNNLISAIPRYTPCEVSLYDDYAIKVGDKYTVDGISTIVMTKTITPSGVSLRSTGSKERQRGSAIFGDAITQAELDAAKVTIDTNDFGIIIDESPLKTYLLGDNVHNSYTGTQTQNMYGTEARLSAMEGITWSGPDGHVMMKLGADYGRDGAYHRGYFGYLDDSTGRVMSWTPVRAQDSWKLIENTSRSSDSTWHDLPVSPAENSIFYKYALRFYILGVCDSEGLEATTFVPIYPPETASPKYHKANCTYVYSSTTIRHAYAEFDWVNQKYKLWIEGGSDREAVLFGCY